MPLAAARSAAGILHPLMKGKGRDLERRQQAKEHSATDRSQQREEQGVRIDANTFEQRKVEGTEVREFTRAGHREGQSQYCAATRERYALGKHLPQQPGTSGS